MLEVGPQARWRSLPPEGAVRRRAGEAGPVAGSWAGEALAVAGRRGGDSGAVTR